jgi:molybdopterin converting factor small subunit
MYYPNHSRQGSGWAEFIISEPSLLLQLHCNFKGTANCLLSDQNSTPAMSVKAPRDYFTVLYFASASSFTKKPSDFLAAPLEAAKLFDTLETMYPGMKQKILASCALTVNLDYIDLENQLNVSSTGSAEPLVIQEGDEVAIIPPVSSG